MTFFFLFKSQENAGYPGGTGAFEKEKVPEEFFQAKYDGFQDIEYEKLRVKERRKKEEDELFLLGAFDD